MVIDPPQIIFSSASAQCQWWQLPLLLKQSFLEVPLCYLTDCPVCFRGVFHQVYTAIISYSFSSCPETYLRCDPDKEPNSRFCALTCIYYANDNNFPVIWCSYIVLHSPIIPCSVHRDSLKNHLTQCEDCRCFQRFWMRFLDDQSFPFYSTVGALSN